MKLLSNYLETIRDAKIRYTHYPSSQLKDTVCFALTLQYIHQANKNENISAVITTQELSKYVATSKGCVVSDDPRKDFYNLHNALLDDGLNSLHIRHEIASSATIAPTAVIEENVRIGENVVIEDYAIIRKNTIIEKESYIASNCIIGARGMHNTKTKDGFIHIEDAGGVHIKQNCEILSGAVIQKSYFCEMTTIEESAKVSVLANIGHASVVGRHTLIGGHTQISGYVTIGENVWIGPGTTIAHNISIGDNADIKIGSVVVTDVTQKASVSGNFAYNHFERMKSFARKRS